MKFKLNDKVIVKQRIPFTEFERNLGAEEVTGTIKRIRITHNISERIPTKYEYSLGCYNDFCFWDEEELVKL